MLIGLDGSTYSANAVALGIRWAKQSGALLLGIGIIDAPTICGPEPVPLGAGYAKQHRDEVRLAQTRQQVQQFLAQFAVRCDAAGVASRGLEKVGLPYAHIMLEAQRCDLILLGQQTSFHFATQETPCDTLQQVLKDTPRPVIAVPEQLGSGTSIVIAYDGSLQAARALQAFHASGLDRSGEVHIVSVDASQEAAACRAERAAEFLRFHDVMAHIHALASSRSPAPVLLEQVRQLNASLLVLGAYGQPSLREFFLGSVTRTVLRESTVPLFLYH
jgi:nucleotide-binding universal stress UspA family protein